jgi:hypothetical protein
MVHASQEHTASATVDPIAAVVDDAPSVLIVGTLGGDALFARGESDCRWVAEAGRSKVRVRQRRCAYSKNPQPIRLPTRIPCDCARMRLADVTHRMGGDTSYTRRDDAAFRMHVTLWGPELCVCACVCG